MSKEIERTLILLKPEAYERKLIGALISRFENKGFEIEAMKMIKASKKLMEDHYSDHKNKPFFEEVSLRSIVIYRNNGI